MNRCCGVAAWSIARRAADAALQTRDHDAAFAAIIEGRCPFGHGRLRRVDLDGTGPAGWCDGCDSGWSAVSHRHGDECGDDGTGSCPFPLGEHIITMHTPLVAPPLG